MRMRKMQRGIWLRHARYSSLYSVGVRDARLADASNRRRNLRQGMGLLSSRLRHSRHCVLTFVRLCWWWVGRIGVHFLCDARCPPQLLLSSWRRSFLIVPQPFDSSQPFDSFRPAFDWTDQSKQRYTSAKHVVFSITGKRNDVAQAQYIFQQIVKSNMHKLNAVRPITNS